MTVTTSVTKIELSTDERDILRKAIDVLNDVNAVINGDIINYVVNDADMSLYNNLYDEINRIEDWVMIE